MHEIVKIYNTLVNFNNSVKSENSLSIEIWTNPLSIVFRSFYGDEIKQCETFKDAYKWLVRWSK